MFKHYLKTSIFCAYRILPRRFYSTDIQSLRKKFGALGHGHVGFDTINYEGHHIGIIQLNNEEKRNALSGKMMVELAEIVDNLERWRDGKSVILTGANQTFCSGADFTVVQNILNPKEGEMMCRLMHDTMFRFNQLPLISVALIQGHALGGGAELAMSCDFRVMTNNSVIQFVHSRMGVTPGWGGATQLVNIVGKQEALKILTSATKIDPERAMNVGLLDKILPDADPLQSTCDWLLPYIKAPVKVIQAIKKVVLGASSQTLQESLKAERAIFKTMWAGEDNLKALEKVLKQKE